MRKIQHIVTGITLLAAGAASAKESSIPQMNPESYPGQLVWLGISFVLLYLIVSQFVAPRVSSVLTARKDAIATAIATAEQLKAAAANTRGDFESAGVEARTKAAAMITAAQADAAKTAADAQAKLATELEAKTRAAMTAIEASVKKAQAEMDTATDNLAQSMAAKLLGNAPAMAKPTKKAS